MDIYHILFNCREWQRERAEILRRCGEEADFYPSMVNQLLGSRRTTVAVQGFLRETRVSM